MPGNQLRFESTGRPIFFGIEQLGETRVFLKKCEVFIIARMIAIFGAQFDGHLEILQSRIGFASETTGDVSAGDEIVDVVKKRCNAGIEVVQIGDDGNVRSARRVSASSWPVHWSARSKP